MNVFFCSNDGNINDGAIVKIEHETPIYEVFEASLNIPLSPIRDTNDTYSNINNAEPNILTTLPDVTLEIGEKFIRMAEKRESYREEMKPRRQIFSKSQHQKVYDLWLNENISIPSTDCRSGHHEIRIGKLQYMQKYKCYFGHIIWL